MSVDPSCWFKNEIRALGFCPPDRIVPGKWHRFPGLGKGPKNRAGYCRLLEDGQAGYIGDWSSDLFRTVSLKAKRKPSRTELAELIAQANANKARYREALRVRQVSAKKKAARIWATAKPDTLPHPYPPRKGIRPLGAKLFKDTLVLPVMSFGGALTSLQFIAGDGAKRLLKYGQKQGCFIPVSDGDGTGSCIVICEGWATGCTLAWDYPNAVVIAAIDAGNLKSVAVGARARWLSANLIIAGDDDRLTAGNPGKSKAQAAADTVGAELRLPNWPPGTPKHLSDFNDLANWLERL